MRAAEERAMEAEAGVERLEAHVRDLETRKRAPLYQKKQVNGACCPLSSQLRRTACACHAHARARKHLRSAPVGSWGQTAPVRASPLPHAPAGGRAAGGDRQGHRGGGARVRGGSADEGGAGARASAIVGMGRWVMGALPQQPWGSGRSSRELPRNLRMTCLAASRCCSTRAAATPSTHPALTQPREPPGPRPARTPATPQRRLRRTSARSWRRRARTRATWRRA